MKIKVYSFLELGITVVAGNILSKVALNVAQNNSIIESNSTLLSSLPSFGVGVMGMTVGIVVANLIQEHLKRNQTEKSMIQFDSVQPRIVGDIVKESFKSSPKNRG